MNGVHELKSFVQLYDKALHDHAKLDLYDSYSIFNILCTLNHLIDWAASDESLPKAARDQALSVEKILKKKSLCDEDGYLATTPEMSLYPLFVVRGLCNSAKHFNARYKTEMQEHFAFGRSAFGDAMGRNFYFYDDSSSRVNVCGCIDAAMAYWSRFRNEYDEMKENHYA